MPFLKSEMIQLLISNLERQWDVIVPVTREGYQPLCAIYSKRCLKTIEEQTATGEHENLQSLFQGQS